MEHPCLWLPLPQACGCAIYLLAQKLPEGNGGMMATAILRYTGSSCDQRLRPVYSDAVNLAQPFLDLFLHVYQHLYLYPFFRSPLKGTFNQGLLSACFQASIHGDEALVRPSGAVLLYRLHVLSSRYPLPFKV